MIAFLRTTVIVMRVSYLGDLTKVKPCMICKSVEGLEMLKDFAVEVFWVNCRNHVAGPTEKTMREAIEKWNAS